MKEGKVVSLQPIPWTRALNELRDARLIYRRVVRAELAVMMGSLDRITLKPWGFR